MAPLTPLQITCSASTEGEYGSPSVYKSKSTTVSRGRKEPEDERARRDRTPDRQRDSAPLVLGHTSRVLLDGKQTGGAFATFELLLPRGASPPLHSHPQDETFYVLDGEVTVWVGEEPRQCRTGAMAFAPGGTPHSFHVSRTPLACSCSRHRRNRGLRARPRRAASWPCPISLRWATSLSRTYRGGREGIRSRAPRPASSPLNIGPKSEARAGPLSAFARKRKHHVDQAARFPPSRDRCQLRSAAPRAA